MFRKMYLFLKELLIPLGFEEQYHESFGYSRKVNFTRYLIEVTIFDDIRDQFCQLQATADSSKKTFELTLNFSENQKERAGQYENFERWMIKNQIR